MFEIRPSVDHALRRQLNDEVHTRPPDSLTTPSLVSYLVSMSTRESAPTELLDDLLRRFDAGKPAADTKHFTTMLEDVRLRWERHTEYTRYSFVRKGVGRNAFSSAKRAAVPTDWLEKMAGNVFVGVHAWLVSRDDVDGDIEDISADYFDGNILIGSKVADERATALTDLRIHSDGFSRLLLINDGMPDAQAGRVLQRLLEIETYRMMALLALPVAQQLTPGLDAEERELTEIGDILVDAEAHQEQELLDRLTRLSAGSQNRRMKSSYRFAAADAYYEIVLQRINELRETRIPGLQTFEEFTTRRLAPAVKTYRAVSKRQQSVLEQMARATKLLSTRVDIARQKQNQSLLASVSRRVKAQLRLQATVEGLSAAAVTYYVVGLVGILAGSLAETGVPVNPAIAMGISIPIVAFVAFLGIRRLRKRISKEDTSEEGENVRRLDSDEIAG